MLIRTATIEDLQQIAEVEAACFPPAEAATEDEFVQRLEYYKEHFWLMFDGDRLIAFVDGMATDQKDLTSLSSLIRPFYNKKQYISSIYFLLHEFVLVLY